MHRLNSSIGGFSRVLPCSYGDCCYCGIVGLSVSRSSFTLRVNPSFLLVDSLYDYGGDEVVARIEVEK